MKKYLFFLMIIVAVLSGCENSAGENAAISSPFVSAVPSATSAVIAVNNNTPDVSVSTEPKSTQVITQVITQESTPKSTPEPSELKVPESILPYSAPPEEKKDGLQGKLICIDAGHGITEKTGKEKIAPDSEQTKAKYVSGADGSLYSEEEINLMVAKKLKNKLEEAGTEVIMTREGHNCDLSNIDRARLANDAGADLMIRIHADSSESSSAKGMSMLIPSEEHISDAAMLKESRKIGEYVLKAAVEATGANSRGCIERPDMTGFNWSEVPVILLEMGFLSNSEEDKKLSDDEYQNKIVRGIVNGLKEYYG